MIYAIYFIPLCLLLASCASTGAGSSRYHGEDLVVLREIREDIAELKHSLSNTQVELQILEEQYDCLATPDQNRESQVSALEKKISSLSSYVTTAHKHLNECSSKLATLEKTVEQQKAALNEVTQMKSSLQTLIHSLQNEDKPCRSYKVRERDSLGKIAKMHGISVAVLKETNQLSCDTIFPGQELKIPVR